ncbi:MAG: methyl-accepting chemotaxis protein, partial [Clostridiales bacterium]|nr:methyl-accepting chemotaxis protein [Clostridiales bacterium]
MNWFRNLKTGAKLTLAFGIMVVFMIVIAGLGVRTTLNTDTTYSNILANNVEAALILEQSNANFLAVRRDVLTLTRSYAFGVDSATLQSQLAALQSSMRVFKDSLEIEYTKNFTANPDLSEEDKRSRQQTVDAILKDFEDYSVTAVDIEKLVTDPNSSWETDKQRLIELSNELAEDSEPVSTGVSNLLETVKSNYENISEVTTDDVLDMVKIIVAIVVAVIIAAMLIALFISKIITGPIVQLQKDLQHIEEGDFSLDVRSNLRDEIGQLCNSLDGVLSVLRSITSDIRKNSLAIEKDGDIDARVDESAYSGDYKVIVAAINGLTQKLVEDTILSINAASEINKGNFNVEIPDLPGKKMLLTNTFRSLRDTLLGFDKDITELITSAENGDLSKRADASAYHGGWNKMAGGLNNLLKAISEPIEEVSDVMRDFSEAKLSVRVRGQYKGTFRNMASAINKVTEVTESYVAEISDTLNKMADQNLNLYIKREYIGDFAPIKTALDGILKSFNELINGINMSAEQVALGAKQISESSMDLAQNSTEQASSVEELSASLSLIAQQTQVNADAASKANELASAAAKTGVKGNSEMTSMLKSMEEITEASRNINRIIKVIDDIAFQTNLLALNAAVEAAR